MSSKPEYTIVFDDEGIQSVLKSGNVQEHMNTIADAMIDDLYSEYSKKERIRLNGKPYYHIQKEHFTKWYSTSSKRGRYSIFGTVYQITRREESPSIFEKVRRKYHISK